MDTFERKFLHIAENSNDLIFLTDENAVITSMNSASKKTLGFRPDEMTGVSLHKFFADGPDNDREAYRRLALESFAKVLQSDDTVKFHAVLRMKQIIAGLDIDIFLQKNVVGGKVEILVKCTATHPEASDLFLERERGTYVISSNLAEGEIITRGLVARLSRFYNAADLKKFQVGLGEILLNAIEHGNLEISFSEKTNAILSGDYISFLLSRQRDPRFADRRVRIAFLFSRKKILFRITDDGPGFDHVSYLKKVATDDSMLELEHGRGIVIARNIFDRIEYNEKGNQILLIKNRKGA